jgi:hypothetical protein
MGKEQAENMPVSNVSPLHSLIQPYVTHANIYCVRDTVNWLCNVTMLRNILVLSSTQRPLAPLD